MGLADWIKIFVLGTLPRGGNAVMLMVDEPEATKLLVETGGKLPIARFRVELVIASVLIGDATDPMEPAAEVRVSVALLKLMELAIPPPLTTLAADTVPPFTFKVPVGRVLTAVP